VDGLRYLDPDKYFRCYNILENGNFGMALPMQDGYIKEYLGRKRKVLFNNVFRKLKY